jgi:hypothetical protein
MRRFFLIRKNIMKLSKNRIRNILILFVKILRRNVRLVRRLKAMKILLRSRSV